MTNKCAERGRWSWEREGCKRSRVSCPSSTQRAWRSSQSAAKPRRFLRTGPLQRGSLAGPSALRPTPAPTLLQRGRRALEASSARRFSGPTLAAVIRTEPLRFPFFIFDLRGIRRNKFGLRNQLKSAGFYFKKRPGGLKSY